MHIICLECEEISVLLEKNKEEQIVLGEITLGNWGKF